MVHIRLTFTRNRCPWHLHVEAVPLSLHLLSAHNVNGSVCVCDGGGGNDAQMIGDEGMCVCVGGTQ